MVLPHTTEQTTLFDYAMVMGGSSLSAIMFMRQFVRYPVDVPAEIRFINGEVAKEERVKDVSLGGLCINLPECPAVGSRMTVSIPLIDPKFRTGVEVVWCARRGEGYDVGMRLLDPGDRFDVRIMEQMCHIEAYRRWVEVTEQRRLSPDQAANEWISKFSSNFPNLEFGHQRIRCYLRHPANIPVECTLLDTERLQVKQLHDISLGGIRFTLPVVVPIGTELVMRFHSIQPPLEVQAKVVWVRPNEQTYEVGVEVDNEEDEAWQSFVKHLSIAP